MYFNRKLGESKGLEKVGSGWWAVGSGPEHNWRQCKWILREGNCHCDSVQLLWGKVGVGQLKLTASLFSTWGYDVSRMIYVAVGKCLLHHFHAFACNLGVFEVQVVELGQTFEMFHPSICYRCATEVQIL
jgi:hypothetical protein